MSGTRSAFCSLCSYTPSVAPESQVWLSAGIPTLAVLFGILTNNRQIDGLEKRVDRLETHLDGRIDSLREEMNARFAAAHQALLRVEGVLDARLKHLEEDR